MEYLKQLSADLEMGAPEKDPTGAYPLEINETLTISFLPLDPGFTMMATIAPCPEAKKEDLFILLMKANLFSQGTLGAAIGLSQDEKLLTLSMVLPYEVDYRDFRETVEDFANIIDYWREKIDEHIAQAQDGIL